MAKGLIAGFVGLALVVWGAYDIKPYLKPKRFRRREAPKPVEPPPPTWQPPGHDGPYGGYGHR